MIKLIDTNYNEQPDHTKVISQHDFMHLFLMYIFKDCISKQVRRDWKGNVVMYTGDSRWWEIQYDGWEGLGVGFSYDFSKKKPVYYRFGMDEQWDVKQQRFAAQFAGDNS